MSKLDDAIAHLYAEFTDKLTPPRDIDYCECCVSAEEIRPLLGVTPKRLPAAMLQPYASHALTTVGKAADFLYFMPRLLELHAADEFDWPDPEITARAVSTVLNQMNAGQRAAIQTFMEEMVRSCFAPERSWALGTWIACAVTVQTPLEPIMAQIEKHPAALVAYFYDNSATLIKGKLSNPFPSGCEQQEHRIVAWLKCDRVKAFVEASMRT